MAAGLNQFSQGLGEKLPGLIALHNLMPGFPRRNGQGLVQLVAPSHRQVELLPADAIQDSGPQPQQVAEAEVVPTPPNKFNVATAGGVVGAGTVKIDLGLGILAGQVPRESHRFHWRSVAWQTGESRDGKLELGIGNWEMQPIKS